MLLAFLTVLFPALSQDPQPPAQAQVPPPTPAKPAWTTEFSAYYMSPPHADDYLTAVLQADRGQLHLEARWAYEARDTASIFGGWTLPIEGNVHGQVTPMLGLAGGDSDGIVPAFRLGLEVGHLGFTTETEYFIGTSNGSDDFLYSWNELTWSFSDKISAGIVGQRTNVFDQELSVDRGFLLSVPVGITHVTLYWFNPDGDDPYVTLAVGGSF
jgi:hypothetical protein